MQKWEYLFVNCEDTPEAWRPRYINNQELRNWEKGTPVVQFTNQMGEQGWELVSNEPVMGVVDYHADTKYGMFAFKYNITSIRMVFKRPKP